MEKKGEKGAVGGEVGEECAEELLWKRATAASRTPKARRRFSFLFFVSDSGRKKVRKAPAEKF